MYLLIGQKTQARGEGVDLRETGVWTLSCTLIIHSLVQSDSGVNTHFGAAVLFHTRDRKGGLSSHAIGQN